MNPSKGNVIHALWNETTKYTVTFMDDGNVIKSESLSPGSTIVYPDEPTKTGHTFGGWDSSVTEMPEHDITINATYTKNKYMVTFNFINGVSPDVRTLFFNETIAYPNTPVKDGFTFNGWDKIVTTVPAENITITAQWTEKPVELVEIVFGVKDMKEDEIIQIIEKFVPTGEEFTIEKFTFDEETGGTRVIIKFVDKDSATSYIEKVSASSDSTRNIIKAIGFAEDVQSFSSPLETYAFSLLAF